MGTKIVTKFERLVISLDDNYRVKGRAGYPISYIVDSETNERISESNEHKDPVDLSKDEMIEILGEGGDIALGLTSARDRITELENQIEKLTSDFDQVVIECNEHIKTISKQSELILSLKSENQEQQKTFDSIITKIKTQVQTEQENN